MINETHINPPVATYQNPARLNDLRQINYISGDDRSEPFPFLQARAVLKMTIKFLPLPADGILVSISKKVGEGS